MKIEKNDIYLKTNYDYEDLKLAICVSDFFTNVRHKIVTYEEIIEKVIEIKLSWNKEFREKTLTNEEIGYIQSYAEKYMLMEKENE